MAAASAPGNVHTTGALMSEENTTGRLLREAGAGEDAGETDGGTSRQRRLHPRPVVGARMIYMPQGMRR